MRALLGRHPLLVLAFLLASLGASFFAGRIVWNAVYWAQHRQEPVQPWMTVGYVGRSWGVKPREIDARAGLPMPENGHPLTLQQIADQRGVPVAEVIAQVEATLADMRAETQSRADQP